MINEKDLRIGNKIIAKVFNNGHILTIESIENYSGEIGIGFKEKGMDEPIDECEGIPITEELLLKLGGEPKGTPIYEMRINKLLLMKRNGQWFDYVHDLPIPFLHTLQNVYYFTKGEELYVTMIK